jgi:hypothetical protein
LAIGFPEIPGGINIMAGAEIPSFWLRRFYRNPNQEGRKRWGSTDTDLKKV